MRKYQLITLLTLSAVAMAQESAPSVLLELYGEAYWAHYDFGPNPKATERGAAPDSRSEVIFPRQVIELDARPLPGLELELEMEYEHLGTGSAMEIEYEEFGEVESEVEKGGEVQLEQVALTKVVSGVDAGFLRVRLGRFYLPFGVWNIAPHPLDYWAVRSPEAEKGIHPATWAVSGVMLLGRSGPLDWSVALTEGLDATGFSSESWIKGGAQGRFESFLWDAPALTLAMEIQPVFGQRFGFSLYATDAAGNRVKDPMDREAWLGIGSVYALGRAAGASWRCGASYGILDGADEITQRNRSLPRALQVPRTPVASQALQTSLSLAYDVAPWILTAEHRLEPNLMLGYVNPMFKADHTVVLDRLERWSAGLGLSWMWHKQWSVRADWTHTRFGSEDLRPQNSWALGTGYFFALPL